MLEILSKREREIATALVTATPVKQIAANLHISPHTVRNHLKSCFRKLNVGSQVELVAKIHAAAPLHEIPHNVDPEPRGTIGILVEMNERLKRIESAVFASDDVSAIV